MEVKVTNAVQHAEFNRPEPEKLNKFGVKDRFSKIYFGQVCGHISNKGQENHNTYPYLMEHRF